MIFSKWNSFSRVTVWGSLAEPSVLVMIDADAGTLVVRDSGDWSTHPWLSGPPGIARLPTPSRRAGARDRRRRGTGRGERAAPVGAGGNRGGSEPRDRPRRHVERALPAPTPAGSTSGRACAWWWTRLGASSAARGRSTTSSRPPWSTPGPPPRPVPSPSPRTTSTRSRPSPTSCGGSRRTACSASRAGTWSRPTRCCVSRPWPGRPAVPRPPRRRALRHHRAGAGGDREPRAPPRPSC